MQADTEENLSDFNKLILFYRAAYELNDPAIPDELLPHYLLLSNWFREKSPANDPVGAQTSFKVHWNPGPILDGDDLKGLTIAGYLYEHKGDHLLSPKGYQHTERYTASKEYASIRNGMKHLMEINKVGELEFLTWRLVVSSS